MKEYKPTNWNKVKSLTEKELVELVKTIRNWKVSDETAAKYLSSMLYGTP